MSKHSLFFAPASLLVLQAGVAHLHAAVDAFLKLDGIVGESNDDKHKGWIEVSSFSFGVANNTLNIGSSSSGAGAGKVTFSPFSITKRMDSASPKLFLACASGQHFATGILEIYSEVAVQPIDYRKAGGSPDYKLELLETINMDTVVLSSVQDMGAGPNPQENLSLNFTRFNIVAPDLTSDNGTTDTSNTIDTGWDLAINAQE